MPKSLVISLRLVVPICQLPNVKVLNLFSGPRRLSQKLQTRFDARVMCKTANRDHQAEPVPAKMVDQPQYNRL